MRVALIISTLGSGGAERVMSTMANYWAGHDREVTLLTLGPEKLDWYVLHPNVNRIGLNLLSNPTHIGQALRNNCQRVGRLRRELKKSRPDVIISFGDATNILTIIASLRLKIPVVISERIDPREHPIGSIWGALRSVLYRHADAIVVQSSGVRDWASRLVEKKAIHVIPNPVKTVLNGCVRPASRQTYSRTIVAMGRLTKQKGFDLLVRAFCQCVKRHAGWSLVILGEGEERGPLEALTTELGLADRVSFPGRVKDPIQILQSADVFVMSSRYEGFPNALLEAMACGLAVISTDCPSGPRDIIRNDVDGLLVSPNDIEALAIAMDGLMDNRARRQQLGTRAVEIVERFGVEKIMNMWDGVLTEACRR